MIFALVLNTGPSETAILVDDYAITALDDQGMHPVPVRARENRLTVATVDGVERLVAMDRGMRIAYDLDGNELSRWPGPTVDFTDPYIRLPLDVDGDGELEKIGPVADGLRWIDGDEVRYGPGDWTSDRNVDWNASDYDGDGLPELVSYRWGVPWVAIVDADTGRRHEMELPAPPGAWAWPGDLDGDGDLDLWILEFDGRGVLQGINDGSGDFDWDLRGMCEPLASVALADLDGDGTSEPLAVTAAGQLRVGVAPDCPAVEPNRTVERVSGDGQVCAVTGPGVGVFLHTPRRAAPLDLTGKTTVIALSMDGTWRLDKQDDTLVWHRGRRSKDLGEGWKRPVMGDGWVAYQRDGCVMLDDGDGERCLVRDKTVWPLGGHGTVWVRDGRYEIELALDGTELRREEAPRRWEHAYFEDQRAWFEHDDGWVLVTSDGVRMATDRAPLRYDPDGRLHVGEMRLDDGFLVQDVPACTP